MVIFIEVGGYALFEILGFAYIQDIAFLIVVAVDARLIWYTLAIRRCKFL